MTSVIPESNSSELSKEKCTIFLNTRGRKKRSHACQDNSLNKSLNILENEINVPIDDFVDQIFMSHEKKSRSQNIACDHSCESEENSGLIGT